MKLSVRRLALLATAPALLLAGAPARAVVCAADNVPAATLLVPYFELDLDQCAAPARERLDTAFSIANVSNDPVLAGITFWTSWGVPVVGYQVYLPGHSTLREHVGSLLCDGDAPQTGPAVSPHLPGLPGPLAFPACNNTATPGFAPNYANPAASPAFVTHLRQALTGQISTLTGLYYGDDLGDQHARGYLTIDTLAQCHVTFPATPGYFIHGGFGIATNQNVLVGEWTVQDESANVAFAEPAVAIESSSVDFQVGDMNFYSPRYIPTNEDDREPLPTTFASTIAFATDGFDGSRQIVWRDRSGSPSESADGAPPEALPLAKTNVTWFDDQTGAFPSTIFSSLPGGPTVQLAEYPSVTGAYSATEIEFEVPSGWQYSNFQSAHSTGYQGGQSWMVTLGRSEGRYETSRAAVPLDGSCVDGALNAKVVNVDPQGGLEHDPPTTMIFWADFEDFFAGWSGVVPF